MKELIGKAQATILSYRGMMPTLGKNILICDGVRIIGDVEIGDDSNIWFNAVLRGDVFPIKIGKRTNIQDGSILHVTTDKFALNIGDDVTVGHNAILHGATIGNRCLIGMGAIVMDGAIIHSNSIVAAGAVVLEGTVVPEGSIFAGVPAKKVKDITKEKISGEIQRIANNYVRYSDWFRGS